MKITTLKIDTNRNCSRNFELREKYPDSCDTNNTGCMGCHAENNTYMLIGPKEFGNPRDWVREWTPQMFEECISLFPDVKTVHLGNCVGDPVLNNHLDEYLKFLKEKGINVVISTNCLSGGEIHWAKMSKYLNQSDTIQISIYDPHGITLRQFPGTDKEAEPEVYPDLGISSLYERIYTVIETCRDINGDKKNMPNIEVHLVDYKETREKNNYIIKNIYNYLNMMEFKLVVNQSSQEDYLYTGMQDTQQKYTPLWDLKTFKAVAKTASNNMFNNGGTQCPSIDEEVLIIDHFGSVSRCVSSNYFKKREAQEFNSNLELPNIFLHKIKFWGELEKFDQWTQAPRNKVCGQLCSKTCEALKKEFEFDECPLDRIQEIEDLKEQVVKEQEERDQSLRFARYMDGL